MIKADEEGDAEVDAADLFVVDDVDYEGGAEVVCHRKVFGASLFADGQTDGVLLGTFVCIFSREATCKWSFNNVNPEVTGRIQSQSGNMPSIKRHLNIFEEKHLKGIPPVIVKLISFFDLQLVLMVQIHFEKLQGYDIAISNKQGYRRLKHVVVDNQVNTEGSIKKHFYHVDGPTQLKVTVTSDQFNHPGLHAVLFPLTSNDVRRYPHGDSSFENFKAITNPGFDKVSLASFKNYVKDDFVDPQGNYIWCPFVPCISSISLTVITSFSRTQQRSGLPRSNTDMRMTLFF